MPILAGLLQSLFFGFSNLLTQWLGKKVAFGSAAVITFAALTALLYAAVAAAVAAISVAFPIAPDGIMCSLFYAINTDAAIVMAASTIAADTALALYKWRLANLYLVSFST